MLKEIISKMLCPSCYSLNGILISHSFDETANEHIKDGILQCTYCKYWFPIEDELLEFVTPSLAYHSDRDYFYQKHKKRFEKLNISVINQNVSGDDYNGQINQRTHYDDFEKHGKMTYDDFENLPFWIASDKMTCNRWKTLQNKSSVVILDIGCGNGRSAHRLMNKNMMIAGIDISKKMLRKAITRTRNTPMHASSCFMVGDATNIPFRNESFDYAMTSGVMSNLPDARKTCSEICRTLKTKGIYFGLENNKSMFRKVFDLLTKVIGIWKNIKGASPEINIRLLEDWFANQKVKITSVTSVFLPPNIFNFAGNKFALKLLNMTNSFFYMIGLKNHGGLIIFEVEKL